MKTSVQVEVFLSDFSDKDIENEVAFRGLGIPDRDDLFRIAEMVAAGEADLALHALAELAPDDINPSVIKNRVAVRRLTAERLF